MLVRGELQIDAINSNFGSFESTLFMKSVSIKRVALDPGVTQDKRPYRDPGGYSTLVWVGVCRWDF